MQGEMVYRVAPVIQSHHRWETHVPAVWRKYKVPYNLE
jgi:hypothetical protein